MVLSLYQAVFARPTNRETRILHPCSPAVGKTTFCASVAFPHVQLGRTDSLGEECIEDRVVEWSLSKTNVPGSIPKSLQSTSRAPLPACSWHECHVLKRSGFIVSRTTASPKRIVNRWPTASVCFMNPVLRRQMKPSSGLWEKYYCTQN